MRAIICNSTSLDKPCGSVWQMVITLKHGDCNGFSEVVLPANHNFSKWMKGVRDTKNKSYHDHSFLVFISLKFCSNQNILWSCFKKTNCSQIYYLIIPYPMKMWKPPSIMAYFYWNDLPHTKPKWNSMRRSPPKKQKKMVRFHLSSPKISKNGLQPLPPRKNSQKIQLYLSQKWVRY